VHASKEISRHTLLTLLHVACEDGVNLNVYANKAVLAPVVTNDDIHNARIRRNKGVKLLSTAYDPYEHVDNKKQDTINPKYQNTIHMSLTKINCINITKTANKLV